MSEYAWLCERCGKSGVAAIGKHAGVYEALYAIEKSHMKTSPRCCANPLHEIRVRGAASGKRTVSVIATVRKRRGVAYVRTEISQQLYDFGFSSLSSRRLAEKYRLPIGRARLMRSDVRKMAREMKKSSPGAAK
jgi:hypothetical protein